MKNRYQPRDGTIAASLIQHLRACGTPLRTPELAALAGCNPDAVQPTLVAAVNAGTVTCCKVDIPGKRPQNEYRIGPGLPPVAGSKELKPARPTIIPVRLPDGPLIDNEPTEPAQPAVARNSGSVRGVASSESPKTPARAVAQKAPRALLPQTAQPAARNEIRRIHIDNHATLTIERDGGADIYCADEVLEIGDYLHVTQGVWRP